MLPPPLLAAAALLSCVATTAAEADSRRTTACCCSVCPGSSTAAWVSESFPAADKKTEGENVNKRGNERIVLENNGNQW